MGHGSSRSTTSAGGANVYDLHQLSQQWLQSGLTAEEMRALQEFYSNQKIQQWFASDRTQEAPFSQHFHDTFTSAMGKMPEAAFNVTAYIPIGRNNAHILRTMAKNGGSVSLKDVTEAHIWKSMAADSARQSKVLIEVHAPAATRAGGFTRFHGANLRAPKVYFGGNVNLKFQSSHTDENGYKIFNVLLTDR